MDTATDQAILSLPDDKLERLITLLHTTTRRDQSLLAKARREQRKRRSAAKAAR